MPLRSVSLSLHYDALVDVVLPQQAEEQTTSDYLLRIFKASIPYMPRTAAKFGQELQLALQPMILKPSTTAGLLVCHLSSPRCSPDLIGDLVGSSRDGCLHVCHRSTCHT